MKHTLTVAFAVLALTGCGGGPRHQPSEKYYLVCSNPKIPYWQEAGAGLAKAATELNVQAELIGPDVYDAKSELAEFKRIMGNKPAGILISPGDSTVLRPEIDAAVAAGVPVITIDSDAPQSQRLFFIGTNNYQAGQMGGGLLAKLLNGKGNVVFYSIANQKNIEERLNGYRAALASSPGIKIAQVIDMKGDARVAFDMTTELIDKNTPVDAFVSLESLSGSEIAEVLERKKVEGKIIIAMDTAASTLGWIEKGKIAATLMQKPYTMGYYGLKTLAGIVLEKQAAAGKPNASDPKAPYPVFMDTGTMLVDKSNLAEVKH
ncbi:substrate-binding domain-containing protein [Paludibaculum fermentans]|uniref:substrate-binding domain-containing protein n=1 Tax=Paludibaculum fermentans TaxID=1473598 RepID=UPI003EBCC4C6